MNIQKVVLTARALGQTWAGIPGIEVTPGGRTYVSCFSGGDTEPHPENTAYLTRSDDGGYTFGPPTVMAAACNGTRVFDPTLWIDPLGRLWLIFNRGNKDTAEHGVFARLCAAPDAPVPVWGEEFRVGYEAPCSFRMNKPTVLSTGEWLMPVTHAAQPVHDWFAGPAQRQGVGMSRDQGRTWSLHGAVEAPNWALENMIMERRDGTLVMYIRTGAGVIWQSLSTDRGLTWSAGEPTTIANPGSRFFIRALPDGDWLLINSPDPTRRTGIAASLSTDEGATWHGQLLLDDRDAVSYPDAAFAADGAIYAVHDRERRGQGETLLSVFRKADVMATQALLPPDWNPKLAGDRVLASLVRVTAPQVKGAHDAEFVCVDDKAYIVEHDNDIQPGHGAGKAMYCVLTVVDLRALVVERTIPLARAGQAFANVSLPDAQVFVPRILRIAEDTLRCYFAVQPEDAEARIWYRDFDVRTQAFSESIHKAKLKTAAGTFDMQPCHFHADAAAHGFRKPACDHGLYIFDAFTTFGGKIYVALNNFPGRQNALALLHDDFETFEVLGHYNEPQTEELSESSVNRLPDGAWMAICRNETGNYHFTTSPDGRNWSEGRELPFVANGDNSKPTFDRFGDLYYLGWQERTRVGECGRSVFNIDISRDGKSWQRKYRFESAHSFQYPTFHEHDGTIWLTVTQSDHQGSSDRIMFGRLD
jgi:hypothetical protein